MWVNALVTEVAGTSSTEAISRRASGRLDSRSAMARQAAAMDLDLLPQRKLETLLTWWKRAIARGARPVALNDAAREAMKSAMATLDTFGKNQKAIRRDDALRVSRL